MCGRGFVSRDCILAFQLLINLRIILMAQFFQNLKHRNEEVRLKAARDLQRFVQTELRELPNERYQAQLDENNQCISLVLMSMRRKELLVSSKHIRYCLTRYLHVAKISFSQISRILASSPKFILQKSCHATPFFPVYVGY